MSLYFFLGKGEIGLSFVISHYVCCRLYTNMYDEISQIGGWMRRGGGSFEQIKDLNSERDTNKPITSLIGYI